MTTTAPAIHLHDAAEGLKAWVDTQISRQLGYSTWLSDAIWHYEGFAKSRSYAIADKSAVRAALRGKGFDIEPRPAERDHLVIGMMLCPPGE